MISETVLAHDVVEVPRGVQLRSDGVAGTHLAVLEDMMWSEAQLEQKKENKDRVVDLRGPEVAWVIRVRFVQAVQEWVGLRG